MTEAEQAAWYLYADMEMQPRRIAKRLKISVRAVNARLDRVAQQMGVSRMEAREKWQEQSGEFCDRCGLREPHICVRTAAELADERRLR